MKKKKSIKNQLILLLGMFLIQLSCTKPEPTDLTQTSFIPKPVSVEATGGTFKLDSKTIIFSERGLETTAGLLAIQLEKMTGHMPEIELVSSAPRKGIYLALADRDNESYELSITKKLITITGSATGCFYGVQTLLQTVPVEEFGELILIPTGIIKDSPYYEYRGAMLDVARHFFSVEDVKRFIDFLAMYKMNVLHLHLSDDQGWRIEIKSWPNLTIHGGSTEVGGGKGGFYTQEEFKGIVKYASERQVTIIPEIDMPGHTNAALSSYPELNCNGKAPELYTGTNVGFSTLCTDKEVVYKFINDVVREISEMIDGPYFHMGGDESHVTALKDYIPFVERVQEIVATHDKTVIGWDEIANSKLLDGTIVQFWSNDENTTMGIEKGAKVIMSPAAKAYLDMKYDSTTTLGLNWAGFIDVEKGYSWDPESYSEAISRENILGVEAPLWSETVTNINEVEYMVFPRLPGYAEIGWTKPELRNWDEYKTRLAKEGKRFEFLGINYYKSPLVPWEN